VLTAAHGVIDISATPHAKGGFHGIALDYRRSLSALRRRWILWSPTRLLVKQALVVPDNGNCRMIKNLSVAAVGLSLLLVDAASAQTADQCNQVRAAVAQYGYRAAKAHADATLSPDEVRTAGACLERKPVATKRRPVVRKRHIAR
jgi:hypothetical protein